MRARFSLGVKKVVFSRRAHADPRAPSARRVALGAEGFDLVEVGAKLEVFAEARL